MMDIVCANCNKSCVQYDSSQHNSNMVAWGVFVDDKNTFEYGIAGQFKLISEKIFKEHDCLCKTCLKKMQYEEYLGVTCQYCNKQFRSYFGDCMGYGCSAIIHNKYIEGGYGSKYDANCDRERIKFIQERPSYLMIDSNICDECIDNLIGQGICKAPEL